MWYTGGIIGTCLVINTIGTKGGVGSFIGTFGTWSAVGTWSIVVDNWVHGR